MPAVLDLSVTALSGLCTKKHRIIRNQSLGYKCEDIYRLLPSLLPATQRVGGVLTHRLKVGPPRDISRLILNPELTQQALS